MKYFIGFVFVCNSDALIAALLIARKQQSFTGIVLIAGVTAKTSE
jgi:hypothetical protein